jgi:multiple sugar transport system permease protein
MSSPRRWRFNARTVLLYVVVLTITAVMLVPFAWMLSASLKLNRDVFTFPIQWIPTAPRWENYVDIWTKIPLAIFIGNTAKITIIVTVLQLLTSSFAAYAFAKLRFPFRDTLFLGYIATIAMPWQVYMVPQFLLMRELDLNNTHTALIILQAFTAFGVFLMRQFFTTVPGELLDAARIDGFSEFGVFWKIALPLVRPALAALCIFTFLGNWNAFLWPLIVTRSAEMRTLPVGIAFFSSEAGSAYELIMTAAALATIPVLVVFAIFQRQIIRGIALTGLKG